jgi:hypothetical protein
MFEKSKVNEKMLMRLKTVPFSGEILLDIGFHT